MKVYVVGIGPGDSANMTFRADAALKNSDVIIGYRAYIELVGEHYKGKELLSTPMRQEVERCRMALEAAGAGKRVCMVCSGDAGVYGMAGLLLETAEKDGVQVEAEVVPGVTAACSGAALLGAPLAHDFAVISLSDLLTPWDIIEKRLAAAAVGDFCISLYNPASKKRVDYLKRACDILLRYRAPQTVCGVVRNAAREGECALVMTLAQLREYEADMFTTVFIGNSATRKIGKRMVTPRGYRGV